MLPYQLHQKLKAAQSQTQTSNFNALSKLHNKPFWIWDKVEHKEEYIKTNGQCCLNDIVGRPLKNGREYPLFDYEKVLYDSLLTNEGSFKDKHLWVKKSTGLGITEKRLGCMGKRQT
jgi:hypothetical protein